MRIPKIVAVLACLSVSFSAPAAGKSDPYASKRDFNGRLWDTPVYDPHSKSYFKMVETTQDYGGRWDHLFNLARSQSLKGVRGRLAIIRSEETQHFINEVLRPPNETWIGLRMTCHDKKLYWVDGTQLKMGKDYTNWGRRWHYPDQYRPCIAGGGFTGNTVYAGIALYRFEGRIRWWAIAPGHYTRVGLIEFPTGKR